MPNPPRRSAGSARSRSSPRRSQAPSRTPSRSRPRSTPPTSWCATCGARPDCRARGAAAPRPATPAPGTWCRSAAGSCGRCVPGYLGAAGAYGALRPLGSVRAAVAGRQRPARARCGKVPPCQGGHRAPCRPAPPRRAPRAHPERPDLVLAPPEPPSMLRPLLLTSAIALALGACDRTPTEPPMPNTATAPAAPAQVENPLLAASTLPFQAPLFDRIQDAHYQPAIEEGMRQHLAEVRQIAESAEAPGFANTIEALERSGALLTRAASIFFAMTSAHTNEALQ